MVGDEGWGLGGGGRGGVVGDGGWGGGGLLWLNCAYMSIYLLPPSPSPSLSPSLSQGVKPWPLLTEEQEENKPGK